MSEQEWEDKLAEVQKHSEHWYNKYKELENKIADIKANCDLAIEGRDVKIKGLEQQIEKMKCCGNCRFNYCERSSECIDKDGNRTFHCWNEEKEKYCDVGKNGKYQCWEIKENDRRRNGRTFKGE